MKPQKSLRRKLFFWYATSLITITAFFYFAVHLYSLPYGNFIVIALLFILALEGYIIIRRITEDLTRLAEKIKTITTQNLNAPITGIKSEDEIGQLSKSFNELLDRLSEAFKRERQFIADVAHELKTPLATLRSNVEITLSKERESQEYKKVLKETLTDTNRIASILKNILDLAYVEADSSKSEKEKVNLSEIINDLKDTAEKLSYHKKIRIGYAISPEIFILGKKEKLERAVLNIIDNAIKYTPDKKNISVTVRKSDGNALFIIKDTGVGISKEELPYIFDRFYRGTKTQKIMGSGLGLAIAKSIIISYQGKIDVQSQVGRETTIKVSFPLAN